MRGIFDHGLGVFMTLLNCKDLLLEACSNIYIYIYIYTCICIYIYIYLAILFVMQEPEIHRNPMRLIVLLFFLHFLGRCAL